MPTFDDPIYHVRMSRLKDYFSLDRLQEILEIIVDGMDFTAVCDFLPEENPCRWDEDYHLGRIAWFVKHGIEDPIVLDNRWFCNHPVGLVLSDGHHRLTAAIIRNDETIPVLYSGHMRILDWLTGETDIPWESEV